MRFRSRRVLAIGAVVVVMTAVACGGDDGGGDTQNDAGSGDGTSQDHAGGGADPLPVTVTAADFSFEPKEFTGHATHTFEFTFVNEDDVKHSFTIDDMKVDIEAAGGKDVTEEFTPEDLGKYEYYCKYHPDTMTGTLTIE